MSVGINMLHGQSVSRDATNYCFCVRHQKQKLVNLFYLLFYLTMISPLNDVWLLAKISETDNTIIKLEVLFWEAMFYSAWLINASQHSLTRGSFLQVRNIIVSQLSSKHMRTPVKATALKR